MLIVEKQTKTYTLEVAKSAGFTGIPSTHGYGSASFMCTIIRCIASCAGYREPRSPPPLFPATDAPLPSPAPPTILPAITEVSPVLSRSPPMPCFIVPVMANRAKARAFCCDLCRLPDTAAGGFSVLSLPLVLSLDSSTAAAGGNDTPRPFFEPAEDDVFLATDSRLSVYACPAIDSMDRRSSFFVSNLRQERQRRQGWARSGKGTTC